MRAHISSPSSPVTHHSCPPTPCASNQIESKYVIEYVVALRAAFLQVEYLCEHHGWAVVNGQLASNEDDDAFVGWGLAVQRIDFMRQLADASQLSVDLLLTHELLSL